MPRCPPQKDVPFAVDVRGFETTIRIESRSLSLEESRIFKGFRTKKFLS